MLKPQWTPDEDWFWEGNVQAAVAEHLIAEGWTLLQSADTASKAQGEDLILERDGRWLIVEVKGYPSKTYRRGAMQGQPSRTRPESQARQWYSHALLSVMRYLGTSDAEVAMAFPDYPSFRTQLDNTRKPLATLDVGVYLVSEGGTVNRVLEHRR